MSKKIRKNIRTEWNLSQLYKSPDDPQIKKDLVSAEKKGRTRLLKVTNNFYEYFDIAESEAKDKIKQAVEEQGIKKMF